MAGVFLPRRQFQQLGSPKEFSQQPDHHGMA
ncbi:hypothetical protein JMJ77_0012439, partial [Colletotrichum scovillei]